MGRKLFLYNVFLEQTILLYGVRVYIGRSSNGRTEAFEAFNWGSIPYLPARFFQLSVV